MSKIFWISIACVFITSLIAMIWCIINAPDGYEDEDGFHEGNPPPEDIKQEDKK